jgi:cysteine-rich repeat protein
MSKRILTLAFTAALAVFSSVLLSGAAQAGPGTVCGDGVEEGAETCDDSNTVNGDGCDENCQDEICGNSIVQPGTTPPEQCDDGNTATGDGCDAACQFECGNGNLDAGEDCDDGNQTNGDGCDDDAANGGNCTASGCPNGVTVPPEACDDGNTIAGDGCENDCTITPDNEQDKKQQACINAVNKNLAGVLKARAGDNSTCVKSVASGKDTFANCFGTDLKQKVAKAGTKTTNTIGKKCNDADEVPGFAFTDAATVNTAADQDVEDAFTVVFGATPNIVAKSADKEGAACQAEVLKQLNALTSAFAGEANKAKKSGLKGGKNATPPPAASPGQLATSMDTAIAGSAKITKAESKANTGIAKKCTDAQVDGLFDCNGANTVNGLTLCVIAAGKEAACNALETGDAIDLNCPTTAIP